MNKHKITKEEFLSLYNPKITKHRYDVIIDKINDRFSEIVLTMIPNVTKKGWFDYGNCGYDGDGYAGRFDPSEYKEEIIVGGEYCFLPEPYGCDNSFPTRWLWEDFEDEFNKEVTKFLSDKERKKLESKQKREALKIKKAAIWESVKQKITKEELKYICLK